MKNLYLVGKAVIGLAFVMVISSCTTTTTTTANADDGLPHFHDDGSVNAVLQFSSWDYTFLVRPRYADGGYLRVVRRDNVRNVLQQVNVQRGTAVVVVGWTYKGEVLDKVVADWKNILGDCGFQRVVVLRAQWGDTLNGSIILNDSTLHVGSVQTAARGG
jgi:hypothetical protein